MGIKVDITTVEVPASLNELYFNLANVSQLENIKSQISSINLTTLMLTHDGLTEISLKALPSTLTTLDVSENPISKISDIEFGWPKLDYLVTRHKQFNECFCSCYH